MNNLLKQNEIGERVYKILDIPQGYLSTKRIEQVATQIGSELGLDRVSEEKIAECLLASRDYTSLILKWIASYGGVAIADLIYTKKGDKPPVAVIPAFSSKVPQ